MSVILPGSYDPVTLGHLAIIERASREYDEVYVVAFVNSEKEYLFTPEERVKMLILATEHLDNVFVSYSDGRVVDYMRDHGIEGIVKGYRDEADLSYEKIQAEYNMRHGGFETVLWRSDPALSEVSSTVARRAIKDGGDLSRLLPEKVVAFLRARH